MAGTITYEFGDGAFVVVVRFNDNLRVDRITTDNRSDGAGGALFTRPDDGQARPAHPMDSPAQSGALFTVVETGAAQRIQLTERRPGVYEGLEGFISWEGTGAATRAAGGQTHPAMRVKVTAADGVVRRG